MEIKGKHVNNNENKQTKKVTNKQIKNKQIKHVKKQRKKGTFHRK